MWSALPRLALVLLVFGIVQTSTPVEAQPQMAPTEQEKAGELSRLIEQWQKTDDPEAQIAALEAALRLEPQIGQWPLQDSREASEG